MVEGRNDDRSLCYLLDLDGETIMLAQGYWMKFVVTKVPRTTAKPHGIDYSLTLHAPDGERLFGIDNRHGVHPPGNRFKARPLAYDHEHRDETDSGRPYQYIGAAQLIEDFFAGCSRRLAGLGLDAKGDPL